MSSKAELVNRQKFSRRINWSKRGKGEKVATGSSTSTRKLVNRPNHRLNKVVDGGEWAAAAVSWGDGGDLHSIRWYFRPISLLLSTIWVRLFSTKRRVWSHYLNGEGEGDWCCRWSTESTHLHPHRHCTDSVHWTTLKRRRQQRKEKERLGGKSSVDKKEHFGDRNCSIDAA